MKCWILRFTVSDEMLSLWWDEGILFNRTKVSPTIVAYVICPFVACLFLVGVGLEIYHRIHPRQVIVTNRRLILPKHRFTEQTHVIAKSDLQARLKESTLGWMELYDIKMVDRRHGTKAIIRSVHFRSFDDFATFAGLIGRTQGLEWTFKGFLPGTKRGRKTA